MGKADGGVEQLRSELKAMQFRLQTAEQSNKTLHLLLQPADQLRNELHTERRKRDGAFEEVKTLEAAQSRLTGQLVQLEASETEARDAAKLWRTRTSELEYACASLAVREDTAHGELQQAHWRERGQAVRSVENSIAHAEVENAEMLAKSEAHRQHIEGGMLQRQLASSGEHVQELQGNLKEARTENASVQASLRRLLQEQEALRRDQETQYMSLCRAVSHSAVLLSRNESLEDELSAARCTGALTANPSAASAAAVERGLPDVLEPQLSSTCIALLNSPQLDAGSSAIVPVSSRQHPLDGLASPLGGQLSPLRSPTSRRDYPGRRGRRVGANASRCADNTMLAARHLPGLGV